MTAANGSGNGAKSTNGSANGSKATHGSANGANATNGAKSAQPKPRPRAGAAPAADAGGSAPIPAERPLATGRPRGRRPGTANASTVARTASGKTGAVKPTSAKSSARRAAGRNGNGSGSTNGNGKAHRAKAAAVSESLEPDRPPVAVLVVDGDAEGRARLCQIITRSDGVTLSGSVGTLADAVEMARRTQPEVVLSELFLPDGDPAALKYRFVPLAPRPQLVVVTRFSVRGARVASMNAGARSCLASTAPPDSVLAAVLAAADGESWDGAGALGSRLDRVSPLEAKVLAGVASGATNDEIARALGYSIHYVKDLLEAVRHRLGAKDRAHAASLAVSLRLIRPAREGRFISAVLP